MSGDSPTPSSPTLATHSSGDVVDPQDDQLLLDVNAVLHQIVSASDLGGDGRSDGDEDEDEDDALSADDDASSADDDDSPRTLSGPELTSLRALENRVRRALSQQRGAWRRTVTGDSNRRVRDHARTQAERTGRAVRKVARRAVTGSGERAIRDWAKEAKVVKVVDKSSFVLGVFLVCATEYAVLKHPSRFGSFYVLVVSVMMALRLYMYARNRWIYFLLDFCYFANASCFVSVLLLPENAALWKLNYAVSNGTLLAAVLAWRNSLVFHSLDKVTSIAIHVLPGLLTYLERWSDNSIMCPNFESGDGTVASCSLGFGGAVADPLLFYTFWQGLYIIKTEVIDRQRLMDNPSIQTSLRWLTRDSKNTMHRIALSTCRTLGILGKDEKFEPEATKTKVVFWTAQLLFTVATLLSIPLMFSSYAINTGYILFVLSATVWNGANYYFEVFAARYIQKLEAPSSGQGPDGGTVEEEPQTNRRKEK